MPKKLTNFEVGDLVFAKVKGFPAWPARVREKKGKKFDVIFFGTNETAVVKPEECSDYLENRKSFTQKYIKKRNYVSALQEIEDAYNELSNAVVTKSEEAVEIMPVEESILEDTDKTFVSEANANKVSLDDSKNESMETDQETTNTTEIKTEKILCSPTPMNQETSPQTPVTPIQAKSEIVSSRGRKIKPKRFMDDDFNEEAATPPAAKRLKIRSTETMDPEPSTAAEAGSAAEGEVVLVDEEGLAVNYLNSVLILNRENTESLAVYTVRDMKLRLAKLEEILSPTKKDNLKNQLSLPSRHENSVLLVSHHNCVFGLYMDIDRPEDFDSKEEEVQYEVRTGNEIMALYCEIESDERKISDIPEKAICRFSKFEQHLCLTREMLDLTDTQSEKKISSLRIEAYIMKLIYDVREHVSLDHSRLNLPKSVAILRQLNKYELNRIMLMKHPLFVRTVMKLANYKGLTSATRPWTATDDRRAEQIRVEAVKLKNKIIGLVNLRSLVWPEFLRVVHNFRNGVHSSTTAEFLEITSEEEYEHMVLLENRKQRKRIADLNAASRVPEQKVIPTHPEIFYKLLT